MALNAREQQRHGVGELREDNLFPFPYGGLPETHTQAENAALLQRTLEERSEAVQAALSEAEQNAQIAAAQAEFAKNTKIGAVVKPAQPTLRGYKAVMSHNSGEYQLQFSPQTFSAFDRIVAERNGIDSTGKYSSPAFNPQNPHYQEFAPLRRNIALLRNYLLCQLFPEGDFRPEANKEDLANFKALNLMAERLGDELARQDKQSPSLAGRGLKSLTSLLKGEDLSIPYNNSFMEAASIPDKGVGVMYDYLYKLHEDRSVKDIFDSSTPHHWPLLARQETPFSDENFRLYSRSTVMARVADAFETNVMAQLRAPEKLSVEDRETSVQYAREILEKLKLLLASSDAKAKVSMFTDETTDESKRLLQIALSYKEALASIADVDPAAVQNNKIFAQSLQAFEQLGYRMKVETRHALQQEYEATSARNMLTVLDETPNQYKTSASTESLLSQVDAGLKEAQRIQQQARIAQRIAQRAARRAAQNSERMSRQGRDAMRMAKHAGLRVKADDVYNSNSRVTAVSPAGFEVSKEAATKQQQLEEERQASMAPSSGPRR